QKQAAAGAYAGWNQFLEKLDQLLTRPE
ncbi:MAG: polyketide cyclase, partial [Burkholderiales bacterium]